MNAFRPTPEQAAIIDAPADGDVLVVAGAGSGKTTTMTKRVEALIARGVAPERILGLTFTRKAAGELLERVGAALMDGSLDGTDPDRALLKPSVLTYDAFFQGIVRQYGLLVGFDQNTQPLSVAGALQLASDVIDEHMDVAFEQDFGRFDSLAGAVLGLSDALGSAMIGSGCIDLDEAIARVRDWDGAFLARLDKVVAGETVPAEKPKVSSIKRTAKDTDASWQAKLDRRDAQLHDLCLYDCGRLLDSTRHREALLTLVEAYARAKRERNMAEFSDFTIAAYQLVERFPSIGERYRRRYSHVLLDEYQDTSTTQAALLAALFHAEDGRSAVTAVGDPFQSIYAWRGASPGAFRMFQRDFGMPAGSKPYPMSVTQRNPRIVLEAANDLTLPLRSVPSRPSSSLMREVDVARLEATDDAAQGTLGVLGYDTAGQEIDGVVRFCLRAAERHPAKSDGKSHVAILFRSKGRMPMFQEALERAGLTTFVVGYSALLERPEVRDLIAVLHAVADHTDAASLMRLLATPRFGISAGNLTALGKLADDANMEQRYHALVQAGIASADAPRSRWEAIVDQHRDQVANAVFLPDLMLREDFGALLGQAKGIDEAGGHALERAGRMLARVRRAIGRPLHDVVRAAVEALGLDIDVVVADALRHDGALDPTRARMPLESVVDLADTYAQEIAIDQTPTLRGFMAWVDRLASVEDEAASLPDAPVDVQLMTVHQAKGLEWDAVAIVGLTDGNFPSNQGDHLKVTLDEAYAGGVRDGSWNAPEYQETANTWLTDPTAAPVPVRADAGILPRFPHDAPAGGDPLRALDVLDDVETVADEAFGSMRRIGDGIEDADPSGWYLTQCEEYGRRLHADERRLMYVALTRSQGEALLTYAANNAPGRDPSAKAPGSKTFKPSNFWLEVHDALCAREDALPAADLVVDPALEADAMPAPRGFLIGEHAREYGEAIVTRAWATPPEPVDEAATLPWPAELSPRLAERLSRGVEAVREARGTSRHEGHEGEGGALTEYARMLAADRDLMAGDMDDADLDGLVKARAMRIAAAGRQSVTSLQARAGGMKGREEREYWRGVVRPVPRVASPQAEVGTRFHAWAERFVNAGLGPDSASGGGAGRADLLEQARRDGDPRIAEWAGRLAGSTWASRIPAWAERHIVVGLDGIGIVDGKLDAVFHGGLDPRDADKRYTIVDWKTGRRPVEEGDVARKLAQLDMYRLLLSAIEGVPLDSIDAILYYVSEPDEGLRGLKALDKSEEDILAELDQDIPETSDND